MVMEEPIKLGMRLSGNDLDNFRKNLTNPQCTPECHELIRMAQEHARKSRI